MPGRYGFISATADAWAPKSDTSHCLHAYYGDIIRAAQNLKLLATQMPVQQPVQANWTTPSGFL